MNENFKPTYLYIKTHNKTKLKYFGKTTNSNPHAYPGSGIYWTRHIALHGDDVSTEICGYYTDPVLLKNDAVKFSVENNIVKSNEWANLIVETGLAGGDTSVCFTEDSKNKISKRHQGVNNPRAKLTPDQVLEIYKSTETPRKLSVKFNISVNQIYSIKRKLSYSDITNSIDRMPGVTRDNKKIRYYLTNQAVIDIFLKEETFEYFKKHYNASNQVVKNIKRGITYVSVTKDLGIAGGIKKYKLSKQDVENISRSVISNNELAKMYGVHTETIRNIKKWKNSKI